MTNCKHHPDYTNELPRLNKIAGQINGIKKMIEERRYCPDIIMQLQAISSGSHVRIVPRAPYSIFFDGFLS